MDSVEVITRYFPELTENQVEQFRKMGPLYADWNRKINLVSRKDIDALYERHVLHSLAIARFIQFRPGSRILDVGTGGGFPGIPLAVCFPDARFTLMDAIRKKVGVVEQIARGLGLGNVSAAWERVEDTREKYDFITARAVTQISPFYAWTKSKIMPSFTHEKPGGILYLKGGDLRDELQELGRDYQVVELKEYFPDTFFETKKLIYIPVVE